uniref:DNA-directed RNA polymerase subunit alpha n=1 Tax=Vicia costata TaxID=1276815 RepID=A0A8A0WU13_9FABA|nr:RNA polymerase alpha subunit [Vicia costata]QSQ72488.1 RNA polymerase alpha subunit [Vicia costata]
MNELVATQRRRWKCVELRVDSERLYYGRFILFPLLKGQGDTIGIVMRRILLGEIEATCVTRAKFDKIPHEYSTIVGIEESIHEILMNLKEVVLRGNLHVTQSASICFKGPGCVTAKDISLPPSVEVIDNTQHIAKLTEAINLSIELQIERKLGYRIKRLNNIQDGSYTLDAVFMPVRNVNHSIHSYGNGNEQQEILVLEIWTNGSLTPKEALYEASQKLIDLFIPFLEEEDNYENNKHRLVLDKLRKNEKENPWKYMFLDQLELPPRIYNCLTRADIHTVEELLLHTMDDLLKIEDFRVEDLEVLKNRFMGLIFPF